MGLVSLSWMVILYMSILYVESDVLGIMAFHVPFSFFTVFPAFIFGLVAYFGIDKQDNTLCKKCAVWGIILSLFYWILFFIQYSIWIPGSGW